MDAGSAETPMPLALVPGRAGPQGDLLRAMLNVKRSILTAKFQKKGKGEKSWKDKNTGAFKSFKWNYIRLEDLMPVIEPLMLDNSIVSTQQTVSCLADGNLYWRTTFEFVPMEGDDAGRQWFDYPIAALKGLGQQEIAAAATPAKRQAFAAFFCIVSDPDRDAQNTAATMAGPDPAPERKGSFTPVQKQTAAERKAATKPAATTAREAPVEPAPPCDPETGEVIQGEAEPRKEGDKDKAVRLWNEANAEELTLNRMVEIEKEAATIASEKNRGLIMTALNFRALADTATSEAEFDSAREVLETLPEARRGRLIPILEDRRAVVLGPTRAT